MTKYSNSLVFGKDPTENIVSCEIIDDEIEIFIEKDGNVTVKFLEFKYWIVSATRPDKTWEPLKGSLFYKFIKYYNNEQDFLRDRKRLSRDVTYSVHDKKESAMLLNGFTYYKGMKVKDVSVLGFDIEATGLTHNYNSKVLLISNTFLKNGITTRKLFCVDDYKSEMQMLDDWCTWVREMNPSIMLGHNIYGYDLPYMEYCARKAGTSLALGRNGSDLWFNNYDSKYRKDGSQDYNYRKAFIFGREIVDTMFVAYKFDFQRKYESYALKQIIKQEGLEVEGRQFYDAANIAENWNIPQERVKIKKYAEHDADDAIALWNLMIPAYFYLTQSLPKSFQNVIETASGSWINSFLVRSYIQDGFCLPRTTDANAFEGAISLGNPGVYDHVYKVDVASLYPSIMLQYEVYDKNKDPHQNFLKMVRYFTEQRLENKRLAKETDDRYYKEVQEAQKIVINSAYGMMGAQGLLFNSPFNAAMVTRKGREILQTALDWAEVNGFTIVNADTDSISISYQGLELYEEDKKQIIEQINALFPPLIHFEDDGYYPTVLVIKAKNYVLWDGKTMKIKGSALKSSKIEKAIKEFMGKVTTHLINKDFESVKLEYNKYIKEIFNVTDISRWASKKTITDKVLNGTRTNETKILDAVQGIDVQMGDKVFVYFKDDEEGSLGTIANWKNDHSKERLLEKLFKTMEIFENVLDIKQFPNYKLKRNKKALEELLNNEISEVA